jgi:alkaline phosphatase D
MSYQILCSVRFYFPIVRTLRSRSKALVEKWVQKVDWDEAGQEVSRQELKLVPKEKVLKYLPLGNYKWWRNPWNVLEYFI